MTENSSSQLERGLGLRDLVLFNLVAILGISWVATAAKAGPGSITLWRLRVNCKPAKKLPANDANEREWTLEAEPSHAAVAGVVDSSWRLTQMPYNCRPSLRQGNRCYPSASPPGLTFASIRVIRGQSSPSSPHLVTKAYHAALV